LQAATVGYEQGLACRPRRVQAASRRARRDYGCSCLVAALPSLLESHHCPLTMSTLFQSMIRKSPKRGPQLCALFSSSSPIGVTPPPLYAPLPQNSTVTDGAPEDPLRGRHLLSLKDFSTDEVTALLQTSHGLKRRVKYEQQVLQPLKGETLSMIFQKRSTRTRVSSETGMALLGGHALFLGPSDIQLGVNESMRDTANVLSRFNSGILARVFAHEDVEDLARYSSVPIINALSDKYHPLQLLADLMTIQEHYKGTRSVGDRGVLEGLTLAWVGDGNNILHSMMAVGPKLGLNIKVATPKGYEPDTDVLERCQEEASKLGTSFLITNDPLEAVNNCDVVFTDTWVSMGQEEEKQKRLDDFKGYQISSEMMKDGGAKSDWKFMHCLPRKPEEVTDEVFYDESRSIVWDEAENRMWTVMSVILSQLRGRLIEN